MNFSKDNYIKIVAPFISFHNVEILIYKKYTKPKYKLVKMYTKCRWNLTTVQIGYIECL